MEHEAQSHLFIFIEAMEAYEGFYDSEWSNQEINKALHTPFYKPLFHLLFAWRGASYVRQMPVMATKAVASSVDDTVKAFSQNFVAVFPALKDRIVLATAQTPLTYRQVAIIEKDLQSLRGQLLATLNPMKSFFNTRDLWKAMIAAPDMRLTLCKSEESAYLSVYYAYEVFLTKCVAIKLHNDDYRWTRARNFERDIEKTLGKSTCDFCWRDQAVTKARLVRNGLLHNGGKMTKELEPFRKQLYVNDDNMFSISAVETSELACFLKDSVTRLLDISFAKPRQT